MFTKGEWKTNKDDWNQEWEIYLENYGSIACGIGSEANANLIAASPMMYEALKEAFDMGLFDDCNDVQFNQIEQALAKAEGKE